MFKQHLTTMGRCAFFTALTSSMALSGCMQSRVVRLNRNATPVNNYQESFHATDKMDVLLAVDPSNLTPAQQQQVSESIDTIIIELERQGIDYHVGLVGAGGGPVTFPGFGSGEADWVSAGLGALTLLGDKDRFLTTQQRRQLQDELLSQVMLGVQNKLGSRTRAQFETNILPLLPIVVKAAQGGAKQEDLRAIFQEIAPLVMQATSNGQLGGNYNEAIKAVLPIVQAAVGGGAQNQDFNSILAAALPIAINVGLAASGASPYVAAASVLLPAVLQLSQKAQNGASFNELLGSVIPIVLAQVGNNQSNDYVRMIGLVIPLVDAVIKGKGLEPRELLGKLLPIALGSIGKQGASSEYTYLLSAVMPVVMNLLQDEKMNQDPDQLLKTISQIGLATVLGALDKGKIGQGGVNEGFLRDEAVLSVIMIGEKLANGEKQEPKALASTFVNILLENKLGVKEKLAFDAILGGNTNICSSQFAKESNVYNEIAKLTGGEVADLCEHPDKFGDILVSSILSKLTEYTLERAVDPTKVHVFLDGLEVPKGATNGWSLSTDGKTIKLNGSYIPSAGSEITVKYVAES